MKQLKLLEQALLAIKDFLVKHFTYDPAKDPAHPDFVPPVIVPDYPVVVPPVSPEPKVVFHDDGWRGGPLHERLDMYDLAEKVCKEEGLSVSMMRDLQATIAGESGWNAWTVNANNKNGTTDWGICQFNDGKNKQGVPFWIGKGATFKDKDECLNDPAKCIRIMAREFKKGNAKWWMAYPSRSRFWDTKPV